MANQTDPEQPGGVDPRRAAPVEPSQGRLPLARLEGRFLSRDRRWRERQPVLPPVEQVLLDQPATDRLGKVGEGKRRERRPGRGPEAAVTAIGGGGPPFGGGRPPAGGP